MLSVLVEGVLLADPSRRTSAKGQPYTVARLRCTADDGESVFVGVIAFSASAAEALGRLGAGDAVAVAGSAALSRWEKGGEARVGLKVTATRVLSVYDAGMRRRAAGRRGAEANDGGEAPQPAAPGHARRDDRARQPRPRFDDEDDEGPV